MKLNRHSLKNLQSFILLTVFFMSGWILAPSDGKAQPVQLPQTTAQTASPTRQAATVIEMQRFLRQQELYYGPMDGIFSDRVEAAIRAAQAIRKLPVTGTATPETLQALRSRVVPLPAPNPAMADLQQLLKRQGFYGGTVNGRYTLETETAVRAAQQKLGMTTNPGIVTPDLVQALKKRGEVR